GGANARVSQTSAPNIALPSVDVHGLDAAADRERRAVGRDGEADPKAIVGVGVRPRVWAERDGGAWVPVAGLASLPGMGYVGIGAAVDLRRAADQDRQIVPPSQRGAGPEAIVVIEHDGRERVQRLGAIAGDVE